MRERDAGGVRAPRGASPASDVAGVVIIGRAGCLDGVRHKLIGIFAGASVADAGHKHERENIGVEADRLASMSRCPFNMRLMSVRVHL